jgi:hypothetical protein
MSVRVKGEDVEVHLELLGEKQMLVDRNSIVSVREGILDIVFYLFCMSTAVYKDLIDTRHC